MRTLRPNSLASLILARLSESLVPVRTSILIAQLGAPRRRVWAALCRLESRHQITRQTGTPDAPTCCPACNRPLPGRRGGPKKIAFWCVMEASRAH